MPTRPDRLTAHFALHEFACHNGVPVPADKRAPLQRLCVNVLEPMRRTFGPGTIVSGYRPKDYNASVGGAERSAHMYGCYGGLVAVAADIVFRDGHPTAWATIADELLRRHYPPGGGLGVYVGGWVHIDTRSYRARWSGAA
jgi:uncharacterized protein YcbK (DUF882 family)